MTFDPRPWFRLGDAALIEHLPYLADAIEEAGDDWADELRLPCGVAGATNGKWIVYFRAVADDIPSHVGRAAAVAELARRVRELLLAPATKGDAT